MISRREDMISISTLSTSSTTTTSPQLSSTKDTSFPSTSTSSTAQVNVREMKRDLDEIKRLLIQQQQQTQSLELDQQQTDSYIIQLNDSIVNDTM
jgi:hypothetical protein